ncbi:ead/Ea22-like family protein [Pseudomonas helleri]|uniref:ead/Ea22-like family protein n=1 Tax=Pseudomonas helleri TaxID=1608996 RepID=UPI003FD02AAC
MSDRSELKRLAETAPSGPWRYWGETANEIFQCSGKRVLIIAHDQSVPACEFIAAANPAAVLSLISDYDSALTQVAALREELAAAAWIIKETLGKDASDLRVQLADAERRNAELIELLRMIDKTWNVQDPSDDDRACWVAIDAAINPKPEASSHEN